VDHHPSGVLHAGQRAAPEGEFWTTAVTALPSDFLWLAEVYWGMEADLQSLGFGFTYDKLLCDRLKGDAAGVLALLRDDAERQGRMARFLENHDEERSVTAYGRERDDLAANGLYLRLGANRAHLFSVTV
jgi:hypothetical protein